ncbi:siderophore-interacting protein [Mycetocola reblochoni]|uniref:Iron utilization protein n=2 Tax=Mycetocola reblochoni TaxID=331618 RepID=A0A1R4J201_9MICO|nr:siderophore-interacting protein [Mycetocola reblochoni]RLP71210.1 siderophore-interacting protein [Mycetocola reblochoni]SJN25775.1 Iron utilization protein [Mycetocola reblochoni REB411]
MPSPATAPARPAYRPYCAVVTDAVRLSPSFVRVTFGCAEFEHFGTSGLDQRIKLILPGPDGTISDIGQRDEAAITEGGWYQIWRDIPTERRSPLRTYTVRRIDPVARRLVIDFVVHPGAGPAGAWAEAAAPGAELVIVGPDQRSEGSALGIDWHPGPARRVLLAGDETAVPAIGSILESLGPEYDVDVLLEVPTSADAIPIDAAEGVRLRWLPRDGAEHGAPLVAAMGQWCARSAELLARAAAPRPQELADVDVDVELLWDSPEGSDGEFYAWMAGEAATVKTLRRMLVTANGVDRKRVAFMGYWRAGVSERQE